MSHVTRERKAAKFWLAPALLEYNQGFAATELRRSRASFVTTRLS